jgi:hypothetical protein
VVLQFGARENKYSTSNNLFYVQCTSLPDIENDREEKFHSSHFHNLLKYKTFDVTCCTRKR